MKSLFKKILFMLLFFSVNYFAQVSYSFQVVRNNLDLESIVAEDGNPYVKLKAANFSNIVDIGKPNLLVKFVNLIIPAQKDVSNISVNLGARVAINLNHKIFPTQYPTPTVTLCL